jgi:two-component system nitrate/nitrite response regulator NarL
VNHDIVYNDQILSIAQRASLCVTTVLVCQNTLIRSGISQLLSGTHFVISDEASDHPSDLPILFLIHGNQAADELHGTIETLKVQWPSAQVVLLTERMDPRAIVQAFQKGVNGLCSTAMSRESLIKALQLVMVGETFIAAAFTLGLLDEVSRQKQTRPNEDVVDGATAAAVASNLSPREAMILHHLTKGSSNKQIARELGLAEATIKVHLKGILRKMKATNRTQAAMWAQQHINLAANDRLIAAE